MAESNQLTWEVENTFVPKYTPNNLKWYEKDGLETWYRQNKSFTLSFTFTRTNLFFPLLVIPFVKIYIFRKKQRTFCK